MSKCERYLSRVRTEVRKSKIEREERVERKEKKEKKEKRDTFERNLTLPSYSNVILFSKQEFLYC